MYLYMINRPPNEETEIAKLEFTAFTGEKTSLYYTLSSKYADIKNSAYIDTCADILCIENDMDSLHKSISRLNYSEERFKVNYINTAGHIDFKSRKNIEREVSDIFPGAPDLHNPVTEFVVTNFDNKWLFGRIIEVTENRWRLHTKRPHTFCNALPSRMARALVNIACQNNHDIRLIDPCCGMGTVVIEALDMGINAYGCDINEIVVKDANINLKYFGFEKRITFEDASKIKGSYDVSIIDLPYGLLSKKGSDMYDEIIGNMRNVCKRSVILSSRDISNVITKSGFKVLDGCIVRKGGLYRHITICE